MGNRVQGVAIASKFGTYIMQADAVIDASEEQIAAKHLLGLPQTWTQTAEINFELNNAHGFTSNKLNLPDGVVTESGIHYDEAGTPWVFTGDMGYVDADGFLFFTGRKKRIIVISGYNVYPYSIEQEIARLPFVREACAVQGYLDGKPCVKLCLALRENTLSEAEAKKETLAYCEANLGHFSVPRKIEFLPALPRTKMDKLDFMTMSDPVPAD